MDDKQPDDIKVDVAALYREENYTDLGIASIRRLVPVKPDGSVDGSREPLFVGQSHVMTAAGMIPIRCRIEAKTLDEAVEKFPEALRKALEKFVAEAKEIERQERSRIIVPGEEGPVLQR